MFVKYGVRVLSFVQPASLDGRVDSKKGTLLWIGMDVWRSGDVWPKYSRSSIKETHVVPKGNRERERERKYHNDCDNNITCGCAVWKDSDNEGSALGGQYVN